MEQLVFHFIPVENVWEQWNICNWFTVFPDRMFRTWGFAFSSLILVSGFSGCLELICAKLMVNTVLE